MLPLIKIEKDLKRLYRQAMRDNNLSLALKIKEAQTKLWHGQKFKFSLQDLSDAELKRLINVLETMIEPDSAEDTV